MRESKMPWFLAGFAITLIVFALERRAATAVRVPEPESAE